MKIIVIGSGPAGYTAAINSAQLGAETVLIEKDLLGGACLNWACIPTKFLLKETQANRDWGSLIDHKNNFVEMKREGLKCLLENKNVKIIYGKAVIQDNHTVKVNDEQLSCDRIIIASGSNPRNNPLVNNTYTARTFLDQKTIGNECVIIGGGAVGLEFGSILCNIGCKVTILEMMPNILPNEDKETSFALERALKRRGISILTNCNITSISDSIVKYIYKEEEKSIQSDFIISGIGQSPALSIRELTELGIGFNNDGIFVNSYLETSVSGIYAIGDVIGGTMLAHVGKAEALIASENAVLGNHKKAEFKAIPRSVFCSPEYSSVGISQEAAPSNALIGKYSMSTNPIASINNERAGFIKVIADNETHQLLGVHILGMNASCLISDAVLAIENNLTLDNIYNSIYSHPTLNEGFWEACANALHKSIDC